MKRVILLMASLLLLIMLIVSVTAQIPEEAGLPTGVQDRLDQYVVSQFAPLQTKVRMVGRARRPWNFSRDLSRAVLGDSVYFQTDSSLTWTAGGGPSPLPFPPKELWCAILEGSDDATREKSYAILFVGLHMDMYSGEWVIHQATEAPFTPESEQTFARIGCRMGMY